MNNIKRKYKRVSNELRTTYNELEILEKEDMVKRYIKLKEKEEKLEEKKMEIYEELQLNIYSTCNHIFARSYTECDYYEGRTYRYYGCVKCGLDTIIYSDLYYDLSVGKEKIMDNFFKQTLGKTESIRHYVACFKIIDRDYAKVKEIYDEIKNKRLSDSELQIILESKLDDENKEKQKKLVL